MSGLSNIFGIPFEHEELGEIYPVLVKDYEVFSQYSALISYGRQHFPNQDDVPLLYLTVEKLGKEQRVIVMVMLGELFKIVFRTKDVKVTPLDEDNFGFTVNEERMITAENYDSLREIIMKQNLMYEPKYFKSAIVKEWAESALEAKSKNGIDMDFEAKITSVKLESGESYDTIYNWTYYQLESTFSRICQYKEYESQMLMLTNPYADFKGMKMKHFAEKTNLYHNPYDDLFKDQSNSKLNGI